MSCCGKTIRFKSGSDNVALALHESICSDCADEYPFDYDVIGCRHLTSANGRPCRAAYVKLANDLTARCPNPAGDRWRIINGN